MPDRFTFLYSNFTDEPTIFGSYVRSSYIFCHISLLGNRALGMRLPGNNEAMIFVTYV